MTTNQDEVQVYEDLKGFLLSDRIDLRRVATEAVLRSLDDKKMIQHGLVAPLAKNCSHPDDAVSVNALKALVHLSSTGQSAQQCVTDLMEAGGSNRMLEIVLSPEEGAKWKERVNYAMSLLANLTRTEGGSVELLGKMLPDEAVVASSEATADELPTKPMLELLMARFLNEKYIQEIDYATLLEDEEALDSSAVDPFQHFAAVLMNSTQVEAGRRFMLKIHRRDSNDKGTTAFQTVLSQLRSPNPIRRRGIAGVIRNCCLEKESAWWFLHEVGLTKHLLYPLAGPEELTVEEKQGLDPDLWLEGPDKKREPDHLTRLFLVESILLLCCTGRKSREKLRLDRCYVILKWADMVEEHEDVSERIYDCVNFLRRDEEGTEEGSSDKFVAEAYRKITAHRAVAAKEDYDDVD